MTTLAAVPNAHIGSEGPARERRRATLACALFGHRNRCGCGDPVLREDGSTTRIRHVLSCLFLGHHYEAMGGRDGHNEYACVECGHPLLYRTASDPWASKKHFRKKVRYLCNLLGHRVHAVVVRAGGTEYACDCGHSFLKPEEGLATVTHPLVCLFAGHFVRFVAGRHGHAEHVCRSCGHTFLFPAGAREGAGI